MIVVGGGPSAPEFYPLIRESGQPVVACSTMLLPLQRAGIKVDACCVLDPSNVMVMHFRGAMTDGELVYMPHVIPVIPGAWNGPKRKWEHRVPGSSVLHLAVDYAVRAGATVIDLIGADFAYTNGKSHADGVVTAYEVRNYIEVEGWRTEPSLVQYRGELASYMASHPEVTFVRHGSGLALTT